MITDTSMIMHNTPAIEGMRSLNDPCDPHVNERLTNTLVLLLSSHVRWCHHVPRPADDAGALRWWLGGGGIVPMMKTVELLLQMPANRVSSCSDNGLPMHVVNSPPVSIPLRTSAGKASEAHRLGTSVLATLPPAAGEPSGSAFIAISNWRSPRPPKHVPRRSSVGKRVDPHAIDHGFDPRNLRGTLSAEKTALGAAVQL